MQDWNVVVTLHEHGFKQAWELLQGFGTVAKTGYYNVVTLQVADPDGFAETLSQALDGRPALREAVARAMPVERSFVFQDVAEFEARACAAVEDWVGRLVGRGFHVRMHRRGFKYRMTSQHEEQFLDHWLIEQTERLGPAAHITFDDPDYIIALETVGQRAGLSLWDRAARARYPFLRLD